MIRNEYRVIEEDNKGEKGFRLYKVAWEGREVRDWDLVFPFPEDEEPPLTLGQLEKELNAMLEALKKSPMKVKPRSEITLVEDD
ncbi:MAG: hypothetical protein MUP55_01015 [Candidatus Aenigmarchaeota archaeon]|nr:hypothetical protein [Candidatus Aenigmarchaeota archaeon]